MTWVRRIGRHPSAPGTAPDRPAVEPIERASPGLAMLFDGVVADRSHAVLDLGPADGASLRVYSRYARWVRFADVLGAATSAAAWPDAFRDLPPNPERPYDLIVAWDALDRLPPGDRPALVDRLAELSAPDARLFLVLESPDELSIHLLRFTLVGTDRIRSEPTTDVRPPHPPLVPADVKRIIEPFQLKRAFSTQVGLREYIAERKRPT